MSNLSSDFKNGGSYLLSQDAYDRYVADREFIGRPDGQFVTPTNQMDDMLKEANGDIHYMENKLGLPDGRLGDNPVRIDIYQPEDYNLRMPDSSMSGTNENFLPGKGKTSGGMSEGVIDQIPNPENNPTVGKISFVNNGIDNTNMSSHTLGESASPSISGGGTHTSNTYPHSFAPSTDNLKATQSKSPDLDGLFSNNANDSTKSVSSSLGEDAFNKVNSMTGGIQ